MLEDHLPTVKIILYRTSRSMYDVVAFPTTYSRTTTTRGNLGQVRAPPLMLTLYPTIHSAQMELMTHGHMDPTAKEFPLLLSHHRRTSTINTMSPCRSAHTRIRSPALLMIQTVRSHGIQLSVQELISLVGIPATRRHSRI